jgi:hypothetical protein
MIGRAKTSGKGVNELNTDTQRDDPVLLGAAEAIVEAEWIRLHSDEHWWDRELDGLLAEVATPRLQPPQARTTTTVRGRQTAARPSGTRRWRARRFPGRLVWATQRAPPACAAAISSNSIGQQRR